MACEIDCFVFSGTQAQAEQIYEAVSKGTLTEEEHFVLLRYLNLRIPWKLEKYWSMEDSAYRKARLSVFNKLPESALGIVQ
jgi:hypothetical protein